MTTKKAFVSPKAGTQHQELINGLNSVNNVLESLNNEGLGRMITDDVARSILRNGEKGLALLQNSIVAQEQSTIFLKKDIDAVTTKWRRFFNDYVQCLRNTHIRLNMAGLKDIGDSYIHWDDATKQLSFDSSMFKNCIEPKFTIETKELHFEVATLINDYITAKEKLQEFWSNHTTDLEGVGANTQTVPGVFVSVDGYTTMQDGKRIPSLEKIVLSGRFH